MGQVRVKVGHVTTCTVSVSCLVLVSCTDPTHAARGKRGLVTYDTFLGLVGMAMGGIEHYVIHNAETNRYSVVRILAWAI